MMMWCIDTFTILNTTKDCYVNVLGDVLKNNKISVTRKAEYLQKINSNSDKIYCEQKEYLNECFLKEWNFGIHRGI